MANAAKLMKQKKVNINEAMKIMKGKVEPEVVEVESGTVTDVNVLDGYTEEELSSKLKNELIEIAEELGLDITGTKAELIEKILEA